MELKQKLDIAGKIYVPSTIRDYLDIKPADTYIIKVNEDKTITIVFDKYNTSENKVNTSMFKPTSRTAIVRDRDEITIPVDIFDEFNLSGKHYIVRCSTLLNRVEITFTLDDCGDYVYRKRNVISFSTINTDFNLKIHQGVEFNYSYDQDGTIKFIFPIDVICKEEHTISTEEQRFGQLAYKLQSEGLCKEEMDEMNSLSHKTEPTSNLVKTKTSIYDTSQDDFDIDEHTIKQVELKPYKLSDKVSFKTLADTLYMGVCPRCGDTIVGDKTLKINNKVHCERCSNDFKKQLLDYVQSVNVCAN